MRADATIFSCIRALESIYYYQSLFLYMSVAYYITTWSMPYGTEGAEILSNQTIDRNIRTGGTHMNNTIQYKGYVGSVEFSEEDGIFYGKVLGIRSLISYEGENAKELLDDFHGAVDDYLESCKELGKEPEVAFKGSFNIRLSPDLHKKIFIYTAAHHMTINKYIEKTLEDSPAAQVVI